ncbi:hypothetical protein D3C71_1757840 [compost metagenome]
MKIRLLWDKILQSMEELSKLPMDSLRNLVKKEFGIHLFAKALLFQQEWDCQSMDAKRL